MLRALLHVALFTGGLLGTAAWIHTLEPLPFWSWVAGKPQYYLAAADRYDTVLLGSSRFHFGLVPEIMDARAKELGKETKTFNLSVSGLRPHDVDTMLDWLIANRPPQLQRVVVELHAWEQSVRMGTWMTDQPIQMHAPSGLWRRLRSAVEGREPLLDRIEIVGSVLAHTTVNALRIGRGTQIVDDCILRAQGKGPKAPASYPDEGYADVVVVADQNHRKLHERWRAEPKKYEDACNNLRSGAAAKWQRAPFDMQSTREQIAKARAAGLELTFLVAPSLGQDFYGRESIPEVQALAKVVVLDELPAMEPFLRSELWYDQVHLVREGAEIMSRIVGEALVGR